MNAAEQRVGDWMSMASGRVFWPLDPRADEVHIDDIAQALSNVCRFGGRCSEFYCPTPDQRVLTDDLRWVAAGDLVLGQRLLGFDEQPFELGSLGVRRRRMRPCTVTHLQPVRRRVIRLETEDGQTVCASEEHPWLVRTKTSGNQKWETARSIANALDDGRPRYMHRFFHPWATASSWDAGWLAGMWDGEGYLSIVGKGMKCGVAQNAGPLLDRLDCIMRQLGFEQFTSFRTGGKRRDGQGSRTRTLQMKGGGSEIMRMLGTLRPFRLLSKFAAALAEGKLAKQLVADGGLVRVVRHYDEGEREVAGIETSTHTYFCEGFGAHNSVAQHSVWVARYVEKHWPGEPMLALHALLHDAAEAYLGDVVRPLKPAMLVERTLTDGSGTLRVYRTESFAVTEDRVMCAIYEHLRLPFPDESDESKVKFADNVALATEARDLMGDPRWPGLPAPAKEHIDFLSPRAARTQFLREFERLTKAVEAHLE